MILVLKLLANDLVVAPLSMCALPLAHLPFVEHILVPTCSYARIGIVLLLHQMKSQYSELELAFARSIFGGSASDVSAVLSFLLIILMMKPLLILSFLV